MNDSMAQLSPGLVRTDVPGWRSGLSWVSSLVLCALFLLSGLWKITDIQGTAVRMVQAKVPDSLGLPAALFFGIVETVGAVMILVPRLRRWGALVLGGLLLAFLGYFAIQYNTLRGADCSCIPWLKRVVGPGFFVGDGMMLLLAFFAGLGSRRPEGLRAVALIAAAVAVFAGVSYGVGAARETGTRAPESIRGGRTAVLAGARQDFSVLLRPGVHALFRIRAAHVEDALGRYAGGGSADQPAAIRRAVHAGHGLPWRSARTATS